MHDLKLALRQLIKSPGFTAVALATLAICLGANLAIFAVVDAILLRPLPFPAADRLVTMYNTYPGASVLRDESSITNYYERRGAIDAFAELSLFDNGTAVVGETGATSRVEMMRISTEFFRTLGMPPVLGRAFTEAETTPQTDNVVILTDTSWNQFFNRDPAVLGRTLTVDGAARTVVGVLPPDFQFLSSNVGLFLPFIADPAQHQAAQRHWGGHHLIARLKPGVNLDRAQAQIDAHNRNMALSNPSPGEKKMEEFGFRTMVVALHDDHVGAVGSMLWLLQAGALFLLLIGALNLGNLLLVRASGRAGELALRQALGARRLHIFREAMTETAILSGLGGLLGLAVGAAGIRTLGAFGVDHLPMAARISFDVRLGLAALVGSFVVGGLLGVPAVWINIRTHLRSTLQGVSRHATGDRSSHRIRHGFIVAQVALTFVLLVGAALLTVSLQRAMDVAPGFRADHTLTTRLSLPASSYGGMEPRLAFIDRLTAALHQQPGVIAAGISTNVPLSGRNNKSAATPQVTSGSADSVRRGSYRYGVAGDYFEAMGIPLVEGRFLNVDDTLHTDRVCVVDAEFARFHWPDGQPVGQRLFQGGQQGTDADAFTVVGVVAPIKQAALTEMESVGTVYYPYRYSSDDAFYLVIRTSQSPTTVVPAVRSVIQTLDPNLPLEEFSTMDTRIDDSLVPRRSPALLAGVFSATALLLAAIGLYGVMAYSVATRTREFGIRMALGAQRHEVLGLVLRQGITLILLGLALGLAAASLLTSSMAALLYDVAPNDPTTLTVAAALLALIATLAAYIPARRATKVDPIIALRAE